RQPQVLRPPCLGDRHLQPVQRDRQLGGAEEPARRAPAEVGQPVAIDAHRGGADIQVGNPEGEEPAGIDDLGRDVVQVLVGPPRTGGRSGGTLPFRKVCAISGGAPWSGAGLFTYTTGGMISSSQDFLSRRRTAMVQTAPRPTEAELVSAEQFCRDLVEETLQSPLSMDNHPFVRAIAAGKVNRDQLIEFGIGMFRLVFNAQKWTAAAYVQVEDQKVRQKM